MLTSLPPTNQPAKSNLKYDSPAKPVSVMIHHSPIVAHHPPEINLNDSLNMFLKVIQHQPRKLSLLQTAQFPTYQICEDVKRESRNCTPGVSYKTLNGKKQWTPVVRRKKTKQRVCEMDTDTDDGGSELKWLHVSCARRVELQKKDGQVYLHGPEIYRRGPVVWTPIALRTS